MLEQSRPEQEKNEKADEPVPVDKPQDEPAPIEVKDHMMVLFKGGVLNLKKRKYCLKIEVKFQPKVIEEQPNTMEQLFQQKQKESIIKATVSSLMMPEDIGKVFPSIADLHVFLSTSAGDESKVSISKEGIKLKKDEENEVNINFKQLIDLETARNSVTIDIQNIQDKLLQFSHKEWKILDMASDIYLKGMQTPDLLSEYQNGQSSDRENIPDELIDFKTIQQYAHYVSEMDEDDFLQEECQFDYQDCYDPSLKSHIEAEQEAIKQFEDKFQDILKACRPSSQIYQNRLEHTDKLQISRATSKISTPFPPGYTPPHMIEQTASDALSTDQDSKLGVLNSKKEKLRIGKKMLKQGYNLEEVINYLQKIEKEQKNGGGQTSYEAPTQGPVRPFHIPRGKPTEVPPAPPKAIPQSNQRAVRQMLIDLLRQKRYKKLEDVKRHMEGQGLITTMETLKHMVDEIRAKNAQRKKEKQSE